VKPEGMQFLEPRPTKAQSSRGIGLAVYGAGMGRMHTDRMEEPV